MTKYLISSNYQSYDDFAFSNVCICDTREKAEELVKEFNKNKNEFKKLFGQVIYLEKDFFNSSIFVDYDEKYILEDKNSVKVFLTSNDFEQYQNLFDGLDIYYQENSFFEFLTFSNNTKSIMYRYCNHEDAKLCIEEIEYI